MKLEPSQNPRPLIVDRAAPDMALLAKTKPVANQTVATVVETENTFRVELAQRATKNTVLMEEILSRTHPMTFVFNNDLVKS
ncbi:MAG TPA: hypothetical protein VIV82_02595 [Verrucomicrobiae bacterium]